MNPDTDTHRHTLFVGIFCTKVQMQYSGGKIAIQQMMLRQLDSLGQKEKENEWHNVILSLTIYTINPKWITDLNVKWQKFLGKKQKKLGDWELDNEYLDLTPEAHWFFLNDKLDFIKIRSVCSIGDPVKRMKDKLQMRENIFKPHLKRTSVYNI